MTPPAPARIAAGLTAEEREVIFAIRSDDVMSLRLHPAADRMRDASPPLVGWLFGYRLTDLGRAVRAALADARAAQGAQDRGNHDGDDA